MKPFHTVHETGLNRSCFNLILKPVFSFLSGHETRPVVQKPRQKDRICRFPSKPDQFEAPIKTYSTNFFDTFDHNFNETKIISLLQSSFNAPILRAIQ